MDHETADDIKRHFDAVAEGLRNEILAGDEALRDEIRDVKRHSDVVAESLRNEIRAGDEALRNEIRARDEALRDEIRDVDEALRGEIRDVKRHSDVIAESLRSEIRLVAEGVAGLDEKFTREFVSFREEVGEQFGEMKTLLRASYGDLDRRVQALERKPS